MKSVTYVEKNIFTSCIFSSFELKCVLKFCCHSNNLDSSHPVSGLGSKGMAYCRYENRILKPKNVHSYSLGGYKVWQLRVSSFLYKAMKERETLWLPNLTHVWAGPHLMSHRGHKWRLHLHFLDV